MRALGPGSVSSLLKIGLDVFWWSLAAITALFSLGSLATLMIPSMADAVRATLQLPVTGPKLGGGLALGAVYCAILLLIVRTLRRIFLTLVAGDPFRPENVGRLRSVGLGLAVLAALNLAGRALVAWWMPQTEHTPSLLPDVTAWFSVVVVFVLAEVFREGARLRREAELTI
jgi:hypothetical protein